MISWDLSQLWELVDQDTLSRIPRSSADFALAALLRRKSEQFTHLKAFMSAFSTQHGFPIRNIQTDNGENVSKESQKLLQYRGIHHRRTVPGDSESNGIAERLNRTLTDMALSLLSQSGLPSKCFRWAILAAARIYDRRAHSRLDSRISPYQAPLGESPKAQLPKNLWMCCLSSFA